MDADGYPDFYICIMFNILQPIFYGHIKFIPVRNTSKNFKRNGKTENAMNVRCKCSRKNECYKNDEALIDLIERYQVLLHSLPGALFLFEK